MPEGPEATSVATELAEILIGQSVEAIIWTYHGGKYLLDLPAQLAMLQFPLRITDLYTKGKQIIITATDRDNAPLWLFSHLGMTGYWSFEEDKHTHLQFYLSPTLSLYYVDQRRFGRFEITAESVVAQAKLNLLAPPLLGRDIITLDQFRAGVTQSKHSYLLTRLLDQHSIVSGIGNYLVAELLYMNRLHPEVKCSALSEEQIVAFHTSALALCQRAFAEGGMTIRDYRKPSGKKGDFMKSLQVYSKSHDPLGYVVRADPGKHQRTIWWVPEVQTLR